MSIIILRIMQALQNSRINVYMIRGMKRNFTYQGEKLYLTTISVTKIYKRLFGSSRSYIFSVVWYLNVYAVIQKLKTNSVWSHIMLWKRPIHSTLVPNSNVAMMTIPTSHGVSECLDQKIHVLSDGILPCCLAWPFIPGQAAFLPQPPKCCA